MDHGARLARVGLAFSETLDRYVLWRGFRLSARALALCTIRLAAAVALATATGCYAPGNDPNAEQGYELSAPVISALERYHRDHGVYPNALADLVPDYVAADALLPPVQNPFPYSYRRVGESYELRFEYTEPGMNACTYKPGAAWECTRHY